VGDFDFDTTGRFIASMSPEGFVWLWNAETGEELVRLRDESISRDETETRFQPSDSELVFSPDGELIVTANGNTIRVWDVSNGVLLQTFNSDATKLAFNPSGTLMASSDAHGVVSIWGISYRLS
jgi:WD40 repeat protein